MKTWNQWLIIFFALLLCGLLYLLAPILTPFLIGVLLAYLVDPLVSRLTRLRLPRLLSVIIVFFCLFLVITLLVVLLIPLIQKQITLLIEFIPTLIAWTQDTMMPWLTTFIGSQEPINVNMIKTTLVEHLAKTSDLDSYFLKTAFQSGLALLEWFINLILIPVVTFYLLLDWNKVIASIRNLLPRSVEPTIVKLTKECDMVLSAFFRGQLLVMLALSIIYALGLTLIGLHIGLILGLIIGMISIVPYLGVVVGIIIASIAAFIQFGSLKALLLVWAIFAIGHAIEHAYLTPTLVGDRIGLHPVAVIFAILAGGILFGFFGVLLALPIAAVIMVWLRFFKQHYLHSQLYMKK